MRTFVVIASLVFAGCAGTPDAEDDCVSLNGSRRVCGSHSVTVPIVGSDGAARVSARVNGTAVELLLDTGAEMTVLSPSLLGAANESVVRADEICVGDLCLKNEPVYAWETPFSAASGPGTNGFIGMRTLQDFLLRLDGSETASLTLGGSACAGTAVPLSFNQYGIPVVGVRVHTLPAQSVTIDTGATYTLLAKATSDALEPSALEPREPAPLCTVNGCQDGVAFTSFVPSYCVGTECESDLSVKFPAFDAVGMTFFARRHVTFDFAGSTLWFCDP